MIDVRDVRAVTGIALLACGLLAGPARAQRVPPADASTPDAITKSVGLDQKMNAPVPQELMFRDETGKSVRLGDYFGKKPVMLVLIQYRCVKLCSEEMKILAESLKQLEFTAGKEFTLLTFSIDPREKPDLAAEYKKGYLKEYGRPAAEHGWHFLTGDDTTIHRLAASIGYRYVYDARTDQYAHPDGVILVTPAGHVARYFFRLNYDPRDLRLGLVEAAHSKIGTPIDALALLCYHYDPITGKYGLAILKVVRLAGIVTVLMMALGIMVMRQWDRHTRRRPGEGAGTAVEGGAWNRDAAG